MQTQTPPSILAESQARTRNAATAGHVLSDALFRLANAEASLALALHPVPRNPAMHVRTAHEQAQKLLQLAFEKSDAAAVSSGLGFVFTLRKSLRRVHDHALDHMNQIEQWLAWQHHNIVPTPTDGWAGSAVTLGEDHSPLSQQEFNAWLWRVDRVAALLTLRAQALSDTELDWQPPDGGWTLRKVLHHVASGAIAYSVWFESPLPNDAMERYVEASRRVQSQIQMLSDRPLPSDEMLYDDDIVPLTIDTATAHVLALESDFCKS